MRPEPRRGAALLTVLVFCAFLASLAAAATRTALSGARAARAYADAARADALGRTASDALAFRLLTGDDAAKRGGTVALRLPGADVLIDYLSESARVDANAAPVALIAAVLAASGADAAEAEAVGARIARFRAAAAPRLAASGEGTPKAPTGGLAAIQAAVEALGPARTPKAAAPPAALRDLGEIAAAWGLSDALAREVAPLFTVSSGTATVDPLLADRRVVLALVGDADRADDYLRRRRQGFANREAALAPLPLTARDYVSFKDAPAVRAVVRIRIAGRLQRRYEAVVAPPPASPGRVPAPGAGAGSSVPILVSWQRLPAVGT